jgi:hypothetical protein
VACLVAVLFGIACGLGSARDGEVTVDTIVASWKEDPDRAMRELRRLRRRADLLIALDALLTLDTAGVVERCGQVPKGAARERCDRVADRAHLWEDEKGHSSQPVTSVRRVRAAPGPAAYMFAPRVEAIPIEGIPQPKLKCERLAENVSCVTKEARHLARNGQWREAIVVCSLLDDHDNWGQECYFNVAEALVHKEGVGSYPEAAEICLHSGEFSARCLQHVVRAASLWTPRSSNRSESRWAALLETAARIKTTWSRRDEHFGTLEVDRYASSVLLASYAQSDPITGDPLDFVPDAWVKHVRAGAAWRLVELEGNQKRSLDEWVLRLEEVLNDRVKSSVESPEQQELFHLKIDNTWTRDAPGDGVIPATFFLGRARRAMSEEAKADAAICILESAFRQGVQVERLLRDAETHSNKVVQWTAMHLVRDQTNRKSGKKGPKGKQGRGR